MKNSGGQSIVIKGQYSPIFPNASSADWINFSPSSTESVYMTEIVDLHLI